MNTLPSKDSILAWVAANPAQGTKRDIAKAFGVKGADRVELKRLLRELEADGHLGKNRKSYRAPGKLPPVTVIQILPPDADGDLFARPIEWSGDEPEPAILVLPRASDPALGEGDSILARLTEVQGESHAYEARPIRRIRTGARKILGVFREGAEGGRVEPVDKGQSREWQVAAGAENGARSGELVEAEQAGRKSRLGLPQARIVRRLGDPSAPKAVSLIAIRQHGIPDEFPDEAIAEAERAKPAGTREREDLGGLPLITIDPSDARDHDDACHARADEDPANPGGHIVWVAIADVAAFVAPGSELDREARKRGNSTYFPDRVVPMLPERLSGDLCSLHEGVPRACLAVEMTLAADGTKLRHRFTRGLMRSSASLNYTEVQAAHDGHPNEKCAPLMECAIEPLYAAYEAARRARERRQPLDLDLPERRIVLSEDGEVVSVAFKERLDAHRLIEEFMILANVAAAEELLKRKHPLLYRVHEEPSPERLDALREVAAASGFALAKGQVLQTHHLNSLLDQARGTDFDELVNLSTLRSMQQAYYHPENFGHFGLALRSYAHFTSPIRRYSDLIAHRALIAAHGWGDDGLSPEDCEDLEATARHISDTERRSMTAERDTADRYLAAYLSERVGSEFAGRISGVRRFGIFVRLNETGADGLVPARAIGREYFRYDAKSETLTGTETGLKLSAGDRVTVKLSEAVPMTGGLMLELLEVNGEGLPKGSRRGAKGPIRRKSARSKRKAEKARRKTERKRR